MECRWLLEGSRSWKGAEEPDSPKSLWKECSPAATQILAKIVLKSIGQYAPPYTDTQINFALYDFL